MQNKGRNIREKEFALENVIWNAMWRAIFHLVELYLD
jgi:hypothetical protein